MTPATQENDVPVRIHCWTKDYEYRGQVSAPRSVSALKRFNSGGSLEFTLNRLHPRFGDLSQQGARVSVQLRIIHPDKTIEWRTLISGPVEELKGEGVVPEDVNVYTVTDDFMCLQEIICWPNPTNAITNQPNKFYTSAGNAEDVLLDLISKNAPRDGVVLNLPNSLSRGPYIWQNVRFENILDKIFPQVMTQAGLRVDITQEPGENTRWLRINPVKVVDRVLTEDSGIILPGAEYAISAPLATRVVVGSSGDDEARVFRQYVNTQAETDWNMSRSLFVDASDAEPEDPDFEDIMQAAGEEALEENGPKTSLKIEMVQTPGFQFGVTFDVGDRVHIKLAGTDVVHFARIHEVELTWNADDGLLVTPRVGEWSESPNDALYKRINKLLKAVRKQEVLR